VPPLPMEQIPWGSKHYIKFGGSKSEDTALASVKTGPRVGAAGSWHQGPNQLVTYIDLTATNSFHQYMFEAPIDEFRTRVFLLNERNVLFFKKGMFTFLNDWLDKKVNERNVFIASQDIKVMNEVEPRLTPPSRAKELMMPADKCILQYRDKLDEFEARGWKLDMTAIKAARAKGDTIYAIPSPSRRETNAWVLDEAPRIAPKESEKQVTLQAAG